MTWLALILACTTGPPETCQPIITINVSSRAPIACAINAQAYVQSAIFEAGQYVKVICTLAAGHSSGSLSIEPVQ